MKKTRTKSPNISKALKAKHRARIINNINNDPDYVYFPEYKNSLKNVISDYPNGVSEGIIAKILKIKTSELQDIFNKVLIKLKQQLNREES